MKRSKPNRKDRSHENDLGTCKPHQRPGYANISRTALLSEGETPERVGSRNNGVCHLSRRFGRDSYPCNHDVQAETAGTLERHRRRNKRLVAFGLPGLFPHTLCDCSGQSTVEFAVIAAGFLAATVGLAALARVFGDGLLVEHALSAASHHIQGTAPAFVLDVLLY